MSSPQPFRYYKFSQIRLYIGGFRVQEFGEDGGITFEYNSDLVETAVSADGKPVFSENNDPLMFCSVTVMQTGEGYKQLAALVEAQKRNVTGLLTVPFLLKNRYQGDIISSPWCVFLSRTPLDLQRTAGTAEFRMALPYAGDSALFGTNN